MKLSLLSAVRNEALHIRELIESALAQSYDDWELLFVDDGSTDATVAIIQEFGDRDRRVKLAGRQQAKGKVSAFNAAFSASSGDVVCIQGGDDIIPPGAFKARIDPFLEGSPHGKLALFKLRTFSDDPKFDGMILPRGRSSSRSGGSLTMSRDLAERVFPIPETLVAEDVWLSTALDAVAETTVSRPDVVLNYRIHDGNSNPRNKPFEVMTEAAHARVRAHEELLNASHIPLRPEQIRRSQARLEIEKYRYEGPIWRILTVWEAPISDRLASLAGSHPVLFAIRTRFYKLFSGLRGA